MTAPRQLLGWTVPEHVMSFDVAPNELTLWCFKHEPRVGSGRITRDGEHRPDQIIDFLKAHAHGATVEYRPNLDPDVAWPLPGVLPETPEPPEDDCAHCSPTHERPESRPWGVYVSPQRDGDGQPTHLVVMPSNGAHVAQSDADWLWQLIRDYAPVPAPQSSPTPLLPLSAPVETEGQVEAADGDLSGSLATEARKVANSLRGEVLVSGEMMARRLRALADDVDEIALKVEGWSPPLPEGEDRPGHGGDPVRRAQFAEEKLAEVIGWCKDADAAAIKCVYVIDRIREVLVDFGQLDKSNQTTALEALEKIDAILDAIPSSLLPADEPGLLRRLSALFASTGRQHPAAWLADAATAAEEGREWPVLADKPKYNLVDVYGPNGELLYAGRLKAREDGGWDATPDGASLPADEVEWVQWSVKYPNCWDFTYGPTTNEEDAREEAACADGNVLGKREVRYGPWVAVPVEPKETK